MIEIEDVLKERGKRYGSFEGHARISQELKFILNQHAFDRDIKMASDQYEALEMICHKIARIINGDPHYIDNWVDIAGYATLVANRLQNEQAKNL